MTASRLGSRSRPQRTRSRPVSAVHYDFALLGIVACLVGLGLVMIFSASYTQANAIYDQSTYFFMRQLRWLVLGSLILAATALVDYRFWQRFAVLAMAGTVLLLIAVLIFGNENLGARRHLFGQSFQPSEFAKLTITFYIAYWLTSKGARLRDVSYGLLPFAVLLGLVAGLVILQPDFGTTVLVVMTALAMFFVAGADPKQLLGSLAIIAITITLAITRVPYATQRLNDYLEGLRDLSANSEHVQSAVLALASGGLFGDGLGDSRFTAWGGVPLPWSDSIFAIVGEELGLVGALAVVALFMALAYRGLRVALSAQDRFGMVLAIGITAWLSLQAFVNIAVNTATLPFSGMTLPFISYGGSSLLACMAGVGVLLSISRYGTQTAGSKRDGADPDLETFGFGRWNWRPRLSNSGRAGNPARASGGRGSEGRRKRTTPARSSRSGRSAGRRTSGYRVQASSTRAPKAINRRVARARRTLAKGRQAAQRRPGTKARRGGSKAPAPRRIPRRRP